MIFLNKIKKLFTDKYFLIFFFGSIAASVAGVILIDIYGTHSSYDRNGVIKMLSRENIPWMLIVILYSPAYILSTLFPFLGDAIEIIFFIAQGFIYGFIGLYIKNMVLARKIQREQSIFPSEPNIPASKNRKFGIVLVYYTIIAAIIYITIFLFDEFIDFGLWIILIGSSLIFAGFIGLVISIIGMFIDNKKHYRLLCSYCTG